MNKRSFLIVSVLGIAVALVIISGGGMPKFHPSGPAVTNEAMTEAPATVTVTDEPTKAPMATKTSTLVPSNTPKVSLLPVDITKVTEPGVYLLDHGVTLTCDGEFKNPNDITVNKGNPTSEKFFVDPDMKYMLATAKGAYGEFVFSKGGGDTFTPEPFAFVFGVCAITTDDNALIEYGISSVYISELESGVKSFFSKAELIDPGYFLQVGWDVDGKGTIDGKELTAGWAPKP